MSLTKEDLKAISDLIDVKLNVMDEKLDKRFDAIDKRFDEQDKKFEEMLINNNLLIAEHVQRVVSESEQHLMT
ncbi:hypothetical protein [Sedimentibacter sp.]|uniref:hypothetical protein n=1 Tax=Sedimentibacter sp. TaxID=1960295 RepID=UPI0028A0660B|nr:hypothetical protein [Sedimentibacter sp.]